MTRQSESPQMFDVAIVGGGLVGASLALMLAQLKLSTVLIEAVPLNVAGQPSFDERTTALSNGSRRIFAALGVWSLLSNSATPIRRIHISDQGRFGFARITAEQQGLRALGYVAVNRLMGEALWARLQADRVRVLAPARVTGVAAQAQACTLHLDDREIMARLVVAADGAQSLVRNAAGIESTRKDYGQCAIIANAVTQSFHDHVAYERFTPHGPIAILPLTDARVGLVWTVPGAAAADVMRLDDAAFMARLQREFGFRLGRFLRVGERHAYPLSLTRSLDHVAPRLAVIGNAAQGLHPVAGQGLNLGLRDAASLAEVLADSLAETGEAFDPGADDVLGRYRDWRRQDSGRIIAFTDALVHGFTQPFAPVKLARDLGLLAFDLLPAAKDALSQLSLGAAGRIPRLARGAPL